MTIDFFFVWTTKSLVVWCKVYPQKVQCVKILYSWHWFLEQRSKDKHSMTTVLCTGLQSVRCGITKVPASESQPQNLHRLPQLSVEFSNGRRKRVIRICGFLFNLGGHFPSQHNYPANEIKFGLTRGLFHCRAPTDSGSHRIHSSVYAPI